MWSLLLLVEARKHHHSLLKDLSAFYGPGAIQTPADGSGANGTVNGNAVNTDVLRDGFWYVDCKADAMESLGDKFGDGASRFQSGATAGTSIVRYDVVMDRENQEPMTPAVCFDFCRTVPDMQFFGLTNGRDCYCEHFYKPKTGGGVCDLPCEGDSATTCGGSGMSSLYQMHACEGGFASDIAKFALDVEDGYGLVEDAMWSAEGAENAIQGAGDELEKLAEGSASPLAQAAKAAAGPLAKSAQALQGAKSKFDKIETDFAALGINPAGELDASDRKAVEAMMRKTKAHMVQSEKLLEPAAAAVHRVKPSVELEDATAAFATYERIVSNATDAVCGGDLTGQPKAGLSQKQCAAACDEEATKGSKDYCVAFQFFDGSAWMASNEGSLCFLFKKVKALTTYSCPKSFLSKHVVRHAESGSKNAPIGPQCHVRHTDFGPAERKVVEAATGMNKCFGSEAPTPTPEVTLVHSRVSHRAPWHTQPRRHNR